MRWEPAVTVGSVMLSAGFLCGTAAAVPFPRPRGGAAATTQPTAATTQAVATTQESASQPGAARAEGGETTPPVIEPTVAEPAVPEPLGFSGRSQRNAAPAGTARVGNDFLPLPDRWRIGIPGDYVQQTRGGLADPYNQNILKGDYPFWGDDKFLIVTATSDTLVEARKLPVPSGVSSTDPGNFDFFGQGDQVLVNQNFILSTEIFQGDSVYRPRDWEFRATVIGNLNFVHASEANLINPSPGEGRDRYDRQVAFQELFLEKHLADLSPNYDVLAVRAGIQGFTSDFRGFLFSDNLPGVRLFGNAESNRTQWNLAAFRQVEKDTNSGLNSFNDRDQNIVIANLYRQDFIWKGYTAQVSAQGNFDYSSNQLQYDTNGVLVRPAPVGTIRDKDVEVVYLGWAGDGHIGRWNISHQFYQALGRESFNPIAGREVDVNAQFFAVEVSYDQDWVRYRASFAYSSGDSDPEDGTARGFDSIFDNPNFAGGGFNYFTRQAVRLTGSGVNTVNRNSFIPDLRTSKEQGQANFVNPGLFLYNVGADFDLTPKLKLITNVSYLQFADTKSMQLILQDNKIGRDIGIDYSIGLQYRPYLNNNVIFTAGVAALTPFDGFKDLYNSSTLYSTFVSVTLTF